MKYGDLKLKVQKIYYKIKQFTELKLPMNVILVKAYFIAFKNKNIF